MRESNHKKGATNIQALFEIYKQRLKAPQKTVVKTFQEVVYELIGVSISKNLCEYTPATKTLKIAVPGPIKSEILLRKQEILTHLKGRIGEKSAPNEIL